MTMRSSPSMTRREDISSTHSITPRSSTSTPRSTRTSERSSPPSSRLTPSSSPKVSPSLSRNQKVQQKEKPQPLHTTPSYLSNTNPAPLTPQTQDPEGMTIEALRAAHKKLQHRVVEIQHKLSLQEEKGRSDQKKIQALELVLQREAAPSPSPFSASGAVGSGRMAESKYLSQIDALSSKIYKLEERNQAMAEEVAGLKSDLRNKKKEHENKMKELQLKHDFDLRALEQQQREFASGLKKETRKDVDGLKQHLVVQETDLQKKHTREVQDMKAEQLERELQLKDVIRRLQDELEHVRQTEKRAAIRKTESSAFSDDEAEGEQPSTTLSDVEDAHEAEEGEEGGEEEGDPEECY